MKIQKVDDIDKWHNDDDPWGYETNPEDLKRKEILLSEIPNIEYESVLDIGCGQGFITKDLPGQNITGIDVSYEAINHAKKKHQHSKINYIQSDIFELNRVLSDKQYDLIIITGVLYPHYIGNSKSLIYMIVDRLLTSRGLLISVHINDWYKARFPFLLLDSFLYPYREYSHKFEKYIK